MLIITFRDEALWCHLAVLKSQYSSSFKPIISSMMGILLFRIEKSGLSPPVASYIYTFAIPADYLKLLFEMILIVMLSIC